jgi:hypothetical protein
MDHHCPWINNCVGFYNRKVFLLTLLYSCILSYTIALGSLSAAYDALLQLQYQVVWPGLLIIGVCACALFFAVILTAFLKFHLKLVFQNLTTIENLEKSEGRTNYNAGYKHNWEQVFGCSHWLWLLPISGKSGKPYGDGVHWDVQPESEVPDSLSKSQSDRAETPRVLRNSVINPALTVKPQVEAQQVSQNSLNRFFAHASEVETDSSFLQSRPRSALTMAPDEEVKRSMESLRETAAIGGIGDRQ